MLTCPILGGNCLYFFFFIWTEKKAEYGSSCDVTLMNLREKEKRKKKPGYYFIPLPFILYLSPMSIHCCTMHYHACFYPLLFSFFNTSDSFFYGVGFDSCVLRKWESFVVS